MNEWPDLIKVEQVAAYLVYKCILMPFGPCCALANYQVAKLASNGVLRSELEAWLRQPEPVGDSEPEK
ncbi:hypothetical protein [Candidatus Amarolinea dominans]|uniref:hypothetical protein n=1 Tax=Candidatus Amarolinea dominans TaxID=3140696 RepID=UPI0031356ABD|nr:hypothetical protein [Anaerolineae bacterium]